MSVDADSFSPAVRRRLAREFAEIREGKFLLPPNCLIRKNAEDISRYTIFLTAPEGSPYANNILTLEIKLTSKYPFEVPKLSCLSKIYHPNKKDDTPHLCTPMTCGCCWAPAKKIGDIIWEFYNSLEEKTFGDIMNYSFSNREVYRLYRNDKMKYNEKVQEYKLKYIENDVHVDSLGVEIIKPFLQRIFDKDNFLLAFYKGQLISDKLNDELLKREVGKFLFDVEGKGEGEGQGQESSIKMFDPNLDEFVFFEKGFEATRRQEIFEKYINFFSGRLRPEKEVERKQEEGREEQNCKRKRVEFKN